MAEVDARALASTPLDTLVERAGTAVAVAAVDVMGGTYGRRVVVIAGQGNNGADGLVAARLLRQRGARVQVVAPGEVDTIGVQGHPVDLVVDAAFGTGFHGHYEAPQVAAGLPVLAVDIPSGLRGDTGEACGRPLAATVTVTFVAAKPGLLIGDGPALAGKVRVVDIGLDPGPARAHLVDDRDVRSLLPPRRRGANKWTAAVLVVAGSPGMTGAAVLSAQGASRAGAGMVRLGVPGADPSMLPATEAVGIALPEVGWATAALEAAQRCHAVVVGPGLGRSAEVAADVRALVRRSPVPVVLDADALVALGRVDLDPVDSSTPFVVTPHDGEYERLVGVQPEADRLAAARSLASTTGGCALVKGPTTVVADPIGSVWLATSGTTALATAGSGDVLSGVIAAFCARGVPLALAAGLAAHVHGRAAQDGLGSGTVAGDLPLQIARLLHGLENAADSPIDGVGADRPQG